MSLYDLDRDVLLQEIHQIRKTLDETSGRDFGSYSSSEDDAESSDEVEEEIHDNNLKTYDTDINDCQSTSSYYVASYEKNGDEGNGDIDNKLLTQVALGIFDKSNHDSTSLITKASEILTQNYDINKNSDVNNLPCIDNSYENEISTPTEDLPLSKTKQRQEQTKCLDKINLPIQTKSDSNFEKCVSSSSSRNLTPVLKSKQDQIDMSNLYVERIFRNFRSSKSKGKKHENVNFKCSANLGTLENLLQVNKRYQEILVDELKKIQLAIARNRAAQTELVNNNGLQISASFESLSRACLGRFNKPYFKDSDGYGPPDNEDTKERKSILKVNPFTRSAKPWRASENATLEDGVYNNNLELSLTPLYTKIKALDVAAKEKKLTDEEKNINKIEMNKLKKEIREVKNLPREEMIIDAAYVDFFKISKNYLPLREEFDCRLQWLNVAHPNINQKKFTKEEDGVIIKLAKKYNNHHWERVAEELATNRTPIQCLQRFQRTLNKDMLKTSWDKESDDLLIKAVKMFGHSWVTVAGYLGDRTSNQCLFRWDKTLNPAIKRGKWDPEEDKLLLAAVEKYGMKNWKLVKLEVPGRTDAQCRDRYVSSVDPNIDYSPFTEADDRKIIELVKKYGVGKWSKLALEFEGRRDNHIWRRYKQIQRESYHKYRRDVLWKKKSVLNYFLHRQQERRDYELDELDVSYNPNFTRDEAKKVENLRNELKDEGLSEEDIKKHVARCHYEGFFSTQMESTLQLCPKYKAKQDELASQEDDSSDVPSKRKSRLKRTKIKIEYTDSSDGEKDKSLSPVRKKNRKHNRTTLKEIVSDKFFDSIRETIAVTNDHKTELPLLRDITKAKTRTKVDEVQNPTRKKNEEVALKRIYLPHHRKPPRKKANEHLCKEKLKRKCKDIIAGYNSGRCSYEETRKKLVSLLWSIEQNENIGSDSWQAKKIKKYFDILLAKQEANEDTKNFIVEQDNIEIVVRGSKKRAHSVDRNVEVSTGKHQYGLRNLLTNSPPVQNNISDSYSGSEIEEAEGNMLTIDTKNVPTENSKKEAPVCKQLETFTLLLQALHVDTASVIRTLPKSSDDTEKDQTKVNQQPSTEPDELPFPQCFPLSPNVATLQAFRTLLLHRRYLFNIVNKQYPPIEPSVPAERDLSYRTTRSHDALQKRFKSTFFWPAFLATFLPKYVEKEN